MMAAYHDQHLIPCVLIEIHTLMCIPLYEQVIPINAASASTTFFFAILFLLNNNYNYNHLHNTYNYNLSFYISKFIVNLKVLLTGNVWSP